LGEGIWPARAPAQKRAGAEGGRPARKAVRGMHCFLIPRRKSPFAVQTIRTAAYGVTVKLLALVPVPPAVVTAMGPVTAPVGTSASTVVSLITL